MTHLSVYTEEFSEDDVTWLCRRVASAPGGNRKISRIERKRLSELLGTVAVSKLITELYKSIGLAPANWIQEAAAPDVPMVALLPDGGYRYIYGHSQKGLWLAESRAGRERFREWPVGTMFLPAKKSQLPDDALTAAALFSRVFRSDLSWIPKAGLGSIVISILALGTSLYSMQVYDRVIGQGGLATLVVLSIGVLISIILELFTKLARSLIIERAAKRMDIQSAQSIFERMLEIRLDQFPASVGTLAAQVRSFEMIRGFQTAMSLYLIADAPFAIFFLFVIFIIGGPIVALIPAVTSIFALAIGALYWVRIQQHSSRADLVGNSRQGLLVEVIQGIEQIKSAGSSWIMKGRWESLSRQSIQESFNIKHLNEQASYLSGGLQQVSYVAMVGAGAYMALSKNELTVGAIIACSIVSGRILGPINQIPALLVQWAHSRVAMENLERIFLLERENHGMNRPLLPEKIHGKFKLVDVEFSYTGSSGALKIPAMSIAAGERVAILGGIGVGKSTLLKLLAGLIKPRHGQVLLDEMDLFQIEYERRIEEIAYIPQSTKLFSGTLRDNLTFGLPQIEDDKILNAAKSTGLSVLIASRPEGLDAKISEGGGGLSGGQQELVAFTRLILSEPSIWLLDEPTASMDEGSELRCLNSIRAAIKPENTLVIVTHKVRLLDLVDRIIVLSADGIVIDGPKNEVIAKLKAASRH